MPLTYVIPDLHGRSDLLDRAMVEISEHTAGQAATVIALGDYVDKGPNSRGVIARLRQGFGVGSGSGTGTLRMVLLKGNHDAMMVAALRDHRLMAFWLSRGGDVALASYGGEAADIPPQDIEWLDARSHIHADRHRIYVHAGLDPQTPLAEQNATTLLGKRYVDDDCEGGDGRHVVHGHDNRPDGPLLLQGRSNLDTKAWKTGRLVIGVFDDDIAGGPIELIEIIGDPAG